MPTLAISWASFLVIARALPTPAFKLDELDSGRRRLH
jgi:hypothetical protein